jgi:hypothetical protein
MARQKVDRKRFLLYIIAMKMSQVKKFRAFGFKLSQQSNKLVRIFFIILKDWILVLFAFFTQQATKTQQRIQHYIAKTATTIHAKKQYLQQQLY